MTKKNPPVFIRYNKRIKRWDVYTKIDYIGHYHFWTDALNRANIYAEAWITSN